jgi:hypothetical protein
MAVTKAVSRPPQSKTQAWLESFGKRAGVLDCDGKRSATPLSALEISPSSE